MSGDTGAIKISKDETRSAECNTVTRKYTGLGHQRGISVDLYIAGRSILYLRMFSNTKNSMFLCSLEHCVGDKSPYFYYIAYIYADFLTRQYIFLIDTYFIQWY